MDNLVGLQELHSRADLDDQMDENFLVPYQFLSLSDVVEEGP